MTHLSFLSVRGGRCMRSPADNPGRHPGGSISESHQPDPGQGARDTRRRTHIQILEGAAGRAAYANLHLQRDECRRVFE